MDAQLKARGALRAWTLSVAFCLAAACAADPGDALKSTADGGGTGTDSAGSGSGFDGPGDETSTPQMRVDTGSGDDGNVAGAVPDATTQTETGVDSSNDTGNDSSNAREAGMTDVHVDAAACLQNIPSTCPNCMTQNASDKPNCQKYLTCYATNGCKPSDPCGSMDGVCGVNTVGGGDAPHSAAVQTYTCACP